MAIENLITDHLDLWTAAVRPKSSAGRGSNSKLDLTGIKKLRELILELAVRGKLVPQDPSDEPASVLLERIAAEKTRLVKEGKIKKPKALPEISEEDKPFELPEGWEWSMLAEIAEINPRNESDDTVDASFVPMSLISTAYNGQHEFEARKWGEIKKGFTHFSNGDIGIAKITPCFENSKAAVFRGLINGIGAGTTELHIARPYTDYVSAFFILLNIKSPIYLKKGEAGMTGTAGQKRLAKDFFSFYPLPIPPFAEQHRIVAKVDELMALCDQLELCSESQLAAHQTLVETLLGSLLQPAAAAEGSLTDSSDADECATTMDGGSVENAGAIFDQNWARLSTHFDTLFTTEASIDALKQTILQLAVMGKLVPQDPSDEPASALLARIAAEKAQLVKEKKIKKEKPLPAISENEKPFELPQGWAWCYLQEITFLITDGKHGDCNNLDNSGFYFLSAKNIQNGKLVYDNARQIVESEFAEIHQRTDLEAGDICMVNTGATVGKMAMAQDHIYTRKTTFQKSVAVIKVASNYISNRYVALFLESEIPNLLKLSGGSAINNLLLGDLKRKLLPLPPLVEQHRIVTKVAELMVICDQLKSRLQTSQQTQLALAESLVEDALV
ncbi:restriction endonuclease subunit S [Aeromonas popoffii]|uniref:Restriction endonuclease subunit S n=1 Tax=Aeromonas popoffii TaxID=70856 RepID=A0ABS5GWH3_9GAMM|nr:restriction endonuclease subunit S [Aeromonas popoffii]